MGNKIVNAVLAQLNSESETQRQKSQELRLSMYLDDYETEVVDLLRAQFHRDNYKRLYPMYASYYNLFKKVVNLKSVIYKHEAQRLWYKRDGESKDEKYTDLIAASNLDTTMQLANKLANINNTSVVRIIPKADESIIQYEAIPSELVSVTQNPSNPSEIESVLHMVCVHDTYSRLEELPSSPSSDITESTRYISKYFYWDKENYIILDADRNPVVQEKNPNNLNPYGIIPYVLVRNLPSISGSIWNETVNHDLYRGTLQVNVLQTYLNNALKLTGYRQPWITGIEADEIAKLDERVSDGLQPIALSSEQAKLGELMLSGGVNELKSSIHDIVSEIADNHGVSFSSRTSSAQKQSGLALSIQQDQINNLREEQLPLYRQVENELAEKSVLIANQDLAAGIDIEGQFRVNFYEEQQQLTSKEKIELDNFYLKHNLKSVADIYKEIDPDCESDEQALERITINKEINDSVRNTFNLVQTEDEEPEDEEEVEKRMPDLKQLTDEERADLVTQFALLNLEDRDDVSFDFEADMQKLVKKLNVRKLIKNDKKYLRATRDFIMNMYLKIYLKDVIKVGLRKVDRYKRLFVEAGT